MNDVLGHVLVVDDSVANLDVLDVLLSSRHYGVRTAADGEEGIDLARANPPDVVLLDVDMPVLDGYATCRILKSDPVTRDVPVIFISALGDAHDKLEAFAAGGADYVTKPFQFEEVLARVAHQIRIARLQREMEQKNAELARAYEETRRKERELRLANEEIARLASPCAALLEDTHAWAEAASTDVARVIGARDVEVFLVEESALRPLRDQRSVAPPAALLETARAGRVAVARTGSPVVVPAHGVTAEVRAFVVLQGEGVYQSDLSRQLVLGFARQLGTALEMRRLRQQLTSVQGQHAASRRALHDQGVATVAICPACLACVPDRGQEPFCPVDGTLLDTSRLLPHRLQERYRLEALLAEGGMGTVFRGWDERLERSVALKVIRPDLLGDAAVRFRLEREALAIAQIRHPGVIQLHDFGELSGGAMFLVMELLHGRDLATLLATCGPGTPRQVAEFLRQAGSAVTAAHRAGVIHRDLKPANFFLSPLSPLDGGKTPFLVKVLDFGVARSLASDGRVTRVGTVVGTPAYMPPEQAYGREVDERSDLWSLAAVAFEALSGCTVGPRDGAWLEAGRSYRLSEVLPGIPAELDEAFEAALAPDPALRPCEVAPWSEATSTLLESVPELLAGSDGWTSVVLPAETETR